MRAAMIAAPGRVELVETSLPEPGPRQVRVRLEGCGICGSNLPSWEGRPWFEYPFPPGAPGHEGWGIVESVGSEVTRVEPGDRVATLSCHSFAEYDLAAEDEVVPLPPELAGRPFPGEALGCAVNVFRRSEVFPGQTVAVLGIGFLGALLVGLCSRAGARVIAMSRRSFALEVAQSMGAAEVIPIDDDDERIIERVRVFTESRGCDCVMEATGMQRPLDLAAELTRERGRLVIAGFHQDGVRQVNMQLWNWRGLDVINAHERNAEIRRAGIEAAAEAVAAGFIDPSPLYTNTFRLDELADALNAMKGRPKRFMKAIVTP
jgi:threonine dehydrogenase-like Zn-dependent dehydrogenase